MLITHGYVSLGPYLCITVVVPTNNDFRRKKLPEILATMNHCRSAPLRRSQQSTTLTRHRKWPIENRSCAGLWTITNWVTVGPLFLCRLQSIATHRDHFVCRLSVRLSVRPSHSHSYVSQATHAFLRMLPLFFLNGRCFMVWQIWKQKVAEN